FAVTIKAKRRDDGNDTLVQERLQQFGIDAFDFAGELLIDALNDARGMGDDGVWADGAEIVGGEAFEDFVREAVGGGQGELQGIRVGHAGAVEIGGLDVALLSEGLDLRGGAVDEHDANVQRAEHGDIQEDIAEIFIGNDGAIDFNDEGFLPELGDVLQNAAQVCQFHFIILLSASDK